MKMGFFSFLFSREDKKKEHSDFLVETAENVTPEEEMEPNPFIEHGIHLQSAFDAVRIDYSGLLAKNGAQEITLMVGYGRERDWEKVYSYPMKRVGEGIFEVIFPLQEEENLKFAFKDSANNWDNNSGKNYALYQS